jgi:hypothetical protein
MKIILSRAALVVRAVLECFCTKERSMGFPSVEAKNLAAAAYAQWWVVNNGASFFEAGDELFSYHFWQIYASSTLHLFKINIIIVFNRGDSVHFVEIFQSAKMFIFDRHFRVEDNVCDHTCLRSKTSSQQVELKSKIKIGNQCSKIFLITIVGNKCGWRE